MNRGTHRNPDSLYEERLNKSYPSGSATRSRLKANGLLVTDSETANDSESTLEAESICVSDGWYFENDYLNVFFRKVSMNEDIFCRLVHFLIVF